MEIVEIASTFPTAVTTTGIVFWVTFATVTIVGGRSGGAACCFAHPEASAAKATKQMAVRVERAQHMDALEFHWDRIMIQVTAYRIGALSPTLLIAQSVKYSTPQSLARFQANLHFWKVSLAIRVP